MIIFNLEELGTGRGDLFKLAFVLTAFYSEQKEKKNWEVQWWVIRLKLSVTIGQGCYLENILVFQVKSWCVDLLSRSWIQSPRQPLVLSMLFFSSFTGTLSQYKLITLWVHSFKINSRKTLLWEFPSKEVTCSLMEEYKHKLMIPDLISRSYQVMLHLFETQIHMSYSIYCHWSIIK